MIDGEYSIAGWNRYMYCSGNPVTYGDPSGNAGEAAFRVPGTGTPYADNNYFGNYVNAIEEQQRNTTSLFSGSTAYLADKNRDKKVFENVQLYMQHKVDAIAGQNYKKRLNPKVQEDFSGRGFLHGVVMSFADSLTLGVAKDARGSIEFERPNESKSYYGSYYAGSILGDIAVTTACLGKTVGSLPTTKGAKSFFNDTYYSNKVIRQMKRKDFHGFPEKVKDYEMYGKVSTIKGGDKIKRKMLKIPGMYKKRDGNFEFIKEPYGKIHHRFFRPKE